MKTAQPDYYLTQIPAKDAIAHCVIQSALKKIDDCRTKCPGVGGDVDAMNLRQMLQNGYVDGALRQAADTLEALSEALGIDARREVIALRHISTR